MPSDRRRILELALESLENQRKKIDEEIAEITHELRTAGARSRVGTSSTPAPTGGGKSPRFSREERLRRSKRMKAYWENWRKKKKQ